MRIKVEVIGEGLHPSETVVSLPTKDGPEELVLDPESIVDSSFEAGWPVAQAVGFYLIQLPRETASGARRVWVPSGSVDLEKMRA